MRSSSCVSSVSYSTCHFLWSGRAWLGQLVDWLAVFSSGHTCELRNSVTEAGADVDAPHRPVTPRGATRGLTGRGGRQGDEVGGICGMTQGIPPGAVRC